MIPFLQVIDVVDVGCTEVNYACLEAHTTPPYTPVPEHP